MYWYKSKHLQTVIIAAGMLFAGLLPACKPDIKETGDADTYFDLKGYFQTEAAKLTAHNNPVFKTAVHNKNTESKKVTIDNWERELNLFISSDINKPAWKDSYSVQNTANTLIYIAQDSTLETKRIIIKKDGDKVKWILIFNHTKNRLYETKEKLTYIPDSMYRIEKSQKVRLLGLNRYEIKGLLGQ
jgi:hypothetical protein